MSIPPAVLHVTDALADVDRVICNLLDHPDPELSPDARIVIMRYGMWAGRTFLDICALYPELEPDHDEEEICHQASL